jgi:hypothetical protein
LTSTEEICRYAPGTDRDVRACGHFTANQGILSGRDDQVMREINPAVDIAASNIDVTIPQDKGPTITASSADIALNSDASMNDKLVGVKIGMTVQFKIYAGETQGSFTTMGTVTAVDNSQKTFSVSNAAAVTNAFETADWASMLCGSGGDEACCSTTRCQIRFTQEALKAELMDEREVEIGDRIRMLTSLGSWETRTVDSVTYTSGYQVNGFVVSEPYENTVSTTAAVTNTIAATTGAIGAAMPQTSSVNACEVGDFCKVTGASFTSSDGVYKVSQITNPITFDSAYGLPGQQASQALTLTKAHLAYNDGAGTTEAKSCSGRGLCDDSSGECQCFKGYTGVDCSIQNALAV